MKAQFVWPLRVASGTRGVSFPVAPPASLGFSLPGAGPRPLGSTYSWAVSGHSPAAAFALFFCGPCETWATSSIKITSCF